MTARSFTFMPREKPESEENSSERGFKYLSRENNGSKKESISKSALRTALQPVQGFLEGTAPGIAASFWQLLGQGEALDPEAIENIRQVSEREGIPFDEEAYLNAAQTALKYVPTVSNIAREVEEHTGLPLEAKEGYQKALRLGSTGAKLTPGTIGQKAISGATAGITSQGLQAAGVPEQFADIAGLGLGGLTKIAPEIAIKAVEKPSGLKQRRFEGTREPREISDSRKEKIAETVEKDFRNIADKIIEKSPIEKTRSAIAENPGFKQEVSEQFGHVEKLAESIDAKIHTKSIKKSLADSVSNKKESGISPSEYSEDYGKSINQLVKKIKDKEVTPSQLVKQYRENNKSLSEAYDPARTYAYNRAKKDALLEYNRAIAETIHKEFPETEFSNLFKETNKQWKEIADAEAIDKFMNGIFDKSINYNKARKFFENKNLALPFERALGKEGFSDFKQVMKDLTSTETPYNMLKVAKSKGWTDLVSTAGAYILHPTLAKLKLGLGAAKEGYKAIVDAMLDKPELVIKWKNSVDALKKGDFAKAEKQFKELDDSVKSQESAPNPNTK